MDLKASIITVLAKSSQPQSARSILAQLEADFADIDKADINKVLYGDRALFASASFLWSLTAAGHARRFKQLRARLRVQNFESRRGTTASNALYQWQKDALEAWSKAGQRGIVEAITGSGKTRIGISAIEDHCKRTGAFAVVLVPTVELMRQWVETIDRQLGISAGMCGDGRVDKVQDCKVIVYVINSAAEYSVAEVIAASKVGEGLLVADECHRYGAQKFAKALEAPYKYTLGLSATVERPYDDAVQGRLVPLIGPIVYRYSYEQALLEQTIADFRVAFVELTFSADEANTNLQQSETISRIQRRICSVHPGLYGSSSFIPAVQLLASQEDDANAKAWLAAVQRRKQLQVYAEARYACLRWLFTVLSVKQRTILFSESIESAEWIARTLSEHGVPTRAHHSELKKHDRQRVLYSFARGTLRAISAPRTLDEGVDVPDADVAVIVAGSTIRRQSIQRIGRVLRAGANQSKQARILVLYIKDSRDDPRTREPHDTFAASMVALGRASWYAWPKNEQKIATWLNVGA